MPFIDCGWAITESCSTWKVTLLWSEDSETGKKYMTETLKREIGRTVRQKRRQLSKIREEGEDLLDYLDVLEARVTDTGKPRISHEEIKKRYA
jgi:hypothetical protein